MHYKIFVQDIITHCFFPPHDSCVCCHTGQKHSSYLGLAFHRSVCAPQLIYRAASKPNSPKPCHDVLTYALPHWPLPHPGCSLLQRPGCSAGTAPGAQQRRSPGFPSCCPAPWNTQVLGKCCPPLVFWRLVNLNDRELSHHTNKQLYSMLSKAY